MFKVFYTEIGPTKSTIFWGLTAFYYEHSI